MTTIKRRFLMKVQKSDGCWLWLASQSGAGYGHMRIAGRQVGAHRIAYELFIGPIPAGLTLDHLCRNRLCVRPDHLEPVTNRENVLRGVGISANNARKTHCPRGHPYDASNTGRANSCGGRSCLTCKRDYYWTVRRPLLGRA